MRGWIGTIVWIIATSVGVGLLIFGWIAAKVYLAAHIGWPERYGFKCQVPAVYSKGGCFVDEILLSPALLQNANPAEIGMFLHLWFVPAMICGSFVYAFRQHFKTWRYFRRNKDKNASREI